MFTVIFIMPVLLLIGLRVKRGYREWRARKRPVYLKRPPKPIVYRKDMVKALMTLVAFVSPVISVRALQLVYCAPFNGQILLVVDRDQA